MAGSGSIRRSLVVIPAFNEESSVAAVVREVHEWSPGSDVVVIDDGSTDATAARASAAGAVVIGLPFNLGVGGAMRTGFRYALRSGYDAVIQVDADGQHDPRFIPELLAHAERGYAVVIGARFAGVGDYRVSRARRVAMAAFSWSLSRVTGARLTDATSGFRVTAGAALPLFAREFPEEYLGDTLESLVLAARWGMPIGQVPVAMRERQGGAPSQPAWRSAVLLARAGLVLGLARWRRRPPVRRAGVMESVG
jgi:hypothetical protein